MKDQFVIAYLGDLSMAQEVVSHACYLSKMLRKGIILLYVEDPKFHGPSTDEAAIRIQEIERAHPDINPSHVILQGSTRLIVDALPTRLNGVIAVAGINAHAQRHSPTHPRQVLRTFAQCKIAYVTVQAPLQGCYRQVDFGIDFRKESKEKLIWASYFARFNNSRLNMLHFDYRDEGLRTKWNNNVRFMDKFFRNVGVNYNQQTVIGRALFPETVICQTAEHNGSDLLISVTTDTRDLDIIEWFAGVAEQRTIRNASRLPILYLNPRDDIYVLCD